MSDIAGPVIDDTDIIYDFRILNSRADCSISFLDECFSSSRGNLCGRYSLPSHLPNSNFPQIYLPISISIGTHCNGDQRDR